jgi:hypothetical protein
VQRVPIKSEKAGKKEKTKREKRREERNRERRMKEIIKKQTCNPGKRVLGRSIPSCSNE